MKYPYDPNDGREKTTGSGHRVVRGGSWVDYVHLVRGAARIDYRVDLRFDVGFRLASPGF